MTNSNLKSLIHQNRKQTNQQLSKTHCPLEFRGNTDTYLIDQNSIQKKIKQNAEELSSLYKTLEEKMFVLRSKIILSYSLLTFSNGLLMSLLVFKILSIFLDKSNNFFMFFISISLLFSLFFYANLSGWREEKYAIIDSDDKDLTFKSLAKYLKKKLAPKELLEASLISQEFKEKKEKTYQDFNFFLNNTPLKNHSKIVEKHTKLLKEKDEVYVSFFDKKMIKLINNSLKD